MSEPATVLSVRIELKTITALKEVGEKEERAVSFLIRKAIEKFLSEYNEKSQPE
jgi:predicted DNA-binding protein